MKPSLDPIAEAKRQWIKHGWADAADGMVMVTSLVRVHQLITERIEGLLRPLDLTFARYEVLRLLAFSRKPMSMTRLGSLLQVHPASVTNAVDRLEAQGFVVRERDEHDGRVVLAAITKQGRAITERATERLNGEVFADAGLAPEDVTSLTDLLSTYRAGAGDLTT